MDISIRSIQPHELTALLHLYEHLNPTDARLPNEPSLQQIWHQILSDPKLECFVADLGGSLIASCLLIVIPNLTRGASPYGLIENVVTHTDYRRHGVGTRLLRHALQAAWSQNCYKVMLLSDSKRKEAHQFYEKVGFKKDLKAGFLATPAVSQS